MLERYHVAEISRCHIHDFESWENETEKFLNHQNRHPKIKTNNRNPRKQTVTLPEHSLQERDQPIL